MVSLNKMLSKVLFTIKVLVAVVSSIAWYFFTYEELSENSAEEEVPSDFEDSSDEDPPSISFNQDSPSLLINQDPPSVWINQDPPLVSISQDSPSVWINQDPPLVSISQDSSSVLINQDPTSLLFNQDPPVVLIYQDPSSLLINQDPPPDPINLDPSSILIDQNPLSISIDQDPPSLFINQDLLPSVSKSYAINDAVQPFQFEYVIDDTVFTEKAETEKFEQFAIYLNCVNMAQRTDHAEISEDDERPLELYTQTIPQGIIINSNVYLSSQQWNTLLYVSETTYTCGVCGVYCDDTEHIKLESHEINLRNHKPLNKYDLSITRKIDHYYHCGVCNILFHKSHIDEHFASKQHEDKMLFAINKVSDIMCDLNTQQDKTKNETYHYSAKAINNNNLDISSDEEDEYYNDYGDPYQYEENFEEQDDEDFYENCEPPLSLEHSYASMARRPKTDELPKVLEIDLGKKKVTVNYNSWNMVISPKVNRFYCMVCTTFGHARQQAEHCRSLDHVERLAKCQVVDTYDMYLVRQVDSKLYHCGHCNNLQLIHEMEDHIETQHSANKHATVDSPAKQPSTPLKNNANNAKPNTTIARNIFNDLNSKNGVNESFRNGNNNSPTVPKLNYNERLQPPGSTNQSIQNGNLQMYHDLRSVNSNINDDIVICAYGKSLKISKMAYNIVCGRLRDYYCGLCEISVEKDTIKQHVNSLQHLILLQRTPFIEAFNIHLFRQIRDALHCALCNELIQLIPEMILSHKFEQKHEACLGEALGQTANNNVTQTPTKKPEKPINTANKTVKEAKNSPIKVKPAVTARVDENILINNASKNIVAANITKDAPNDIETSTIASDDIVQDSTANLYSTATPTEEEKIALLKIIQEGNTIVETPIAENLDNDNIESTEFVLVKNGIKEEADDESVDSDDSAAEEFDFEEYVYVKLGNAYIKITNTSYNTLVEVGDGTKYCFVCALVVDRELKKHVDSRGHAENMEKCKFVDKYKEDLLRQIYLMYHCSICNVLVTRKQLSHHLSWPTHVLQTENTKISGKQRKTDIKTGMKQYTITTQKEDIYLNESETKIKIFLNVAIQKDNTASVARKNKIVIFNDNVLKISFDSWHSLNQVENGWRCKVCQCELSAKEVGNHVASDWHVGNLDQFEKQHSPALIRKINDTTLNCVMCNTEVFNKKHIIREHIQGKKHKKSFDAILEESSVANSYADCDEDVLTL